MFPLQFCHVCLSWITRKTISCVLKTFFFFSKLMRFHVLICTMSRLMRTNPNVSGKMFPIRQLSGWRQWIFCVNIIIWSQIQPPRLLDTWTTGVGTCYVLCFSSSIFYYVEVLCHKRFPFKKKIFQVNYPFKASRKASIWSWSWPPAPLLIGKATYTVKYAHYCLT